MLCILIVIFVERKKTYQCETDFSLVIVLFFSKINLHGGFQKWNIILHGRSESNIQNLIKNWRDWETQWWKGMKFFESILLFLGEVGLDTTNILPCVKFYKRNATEQLAVYSNVRPVLQFWVSYAKSYRRQLLPWGLAYYIMQFRAIKVEISCCALEIFKHENYAPEESRIIIVVWTIPR